MPPLIRKMVVNEGTDDETSFGYFSIGMRVGPKAFNDNWDVMLVQAMLSYLYPTERGTPDNACPGVTGAYDKATARAIYNFQTRHRLEADWFIDPLPSHYGRIIVNSQKNQMFTMAKLYILVMEKALFEPLAMNPVMDVLGRLTAAFPQISQIAKMMRENADDANLF